MYTGPAANPLFKDGKNGAKYLKKWLSITIYTQIYGATFSSGLIVDGVLFHSKDDFATTTEVKNADVYFHTRNVHLHVPQGHVRSISVFGPQRLYLQKPLAQPGNFPTTAWD